MPKRTSLLLGIAFIVPGILFLAPIFFHDFSEGSVVGPFFGICLGLTFLIVGIRLIAKFYEIDEAKTNLLSDTSLQNNKQLNLANPENAIIDPQSENKPTNFIKYVALSPIAALCLGYALSGGCKLLEWGFGVSCDGVASLIEACAYFGFLGWFISLPLAGMLKLIAWSGK